MTYGELTRRLRQLGMQYHHKGRGSHEIWWNPASKLYTQIPVHRGREIPPGTLRAILRQLGLSENDLRDA